MASVIHVRDRRPGDIAIHRGTKWGNPFRIGPDGDRGFVIRAYRKYLLDRPDLLVQLGELRGKRLACYCHPEPCHGDVLLELLELLDAGQLYDTRYGVLVTEGRLG